MYLIKVGLPLDRGGMPGWDSYMTGMLGSLFSEPRRSGTNSQYYHVEGFHWKDSWIIKLKVRG